MLRKTAYRALSWPRKQVESLEKTSFQAKRSLGNVSEEEIVEELEDLSLEELEDRDVRELEVFARHQVGGEWGIDEGFRSKPAEIITNGRTPSAESESWRITIPKAESSLGILRNYDNIFSDSSVPSRKVEDVFHEVGHLMAAADEGTTTEYETLEEYMYHESMAMAAVQTTIDESQISEYYTSTQQDLLSLSKRSPMYHVDQFIEERQDYLEVLESVQSEVEELIWDRAEPLDVQKNLRELKETTRSLRTEKGLDTFIQEDQSVLKKIREDLFKFTKYNVKTSSSGELDPVKSREDEEYEFEVSDLKYVREVFGESRKIGPAEVKEKLSGYIERAIDVLESVEREEIEEYRQHLLNAEAESFTLHGHALGYELGKKLTDSEEYDVGKLAKMPEEEAIKEIRPLMHKVQEEYGLKLPLDMKVDYLNTMDSEIERKNFVNYFSQ